jgi:hypothetical protein
MKCESCRRRIWFWQARYTLLNGSAVLDFHGECACDWLLWQLCRIREHFLEPDSPRLQKVSWL